MCLLFETIKLKDGVFFNLHLHQKRMNDARKKLLGLSEDILLEEHLTPPVSVGKGIYKCRIDYAENIKKINFDKYNYRKIEFLKLVECNDISYQYKFCDRRKFEELKNDIGVDEILIVKNGFISDTSFSNIIFFDGNKWLTPDTPLLKGVKRQELLEKGLISEQEIRPTDLINFSKARLINAMLDLGDSVEIDIANISFWTNKF